MSDDDQTASGNLVLEPDLTVFSVGRHYLIRDRLGGIESIEYTEPVALLWAIAEQLVSLGSRYDAKRLFIGYKPGDKHHDMHPKPCSECECGCDPDESHDD